MMTLTPGKSGHVPNEVYRVHKKRLQIIDVEPDKDQSRHLEPQTTMMSAEGVELLEEALAELRKQWPLKTDPEAYLQNDKYKGSANWVLAEQLVEVKKQLEKTRKPEDE
jgi:hypothetical protein